MPFGGVIAWKEGTQTICTHTYTDTLAGVFGCYFSEQWEANRTAEEDRSRDTAPVNKQRPMATAMATHTNTHGTGLGSMLNEDRCDSKAHQHVSSHSKVKGYFPEVTGTGTYWFGLAKHLNILLMLQSHKGKAVVEGCCTAKFVVISLPLSFKDRLGLLQSDVFASRQH